MLCSISGSSERAREFAPFDDVMGGETYAYSSAGGSFRTDDDEDLYEGFNYSIDLVPPQTGDYQSSYGAYPSSRYNTPGTAYRYAYIHFFDFHTNPLGV